MGTNEKICALPNIEINKLSGSLNLIGLINLSGPSWKTTSGASLINPGTSMVNINANITFTGQNLSLFNIHIFANSQLITLSPASMGTIITFAMVNDFSPFTLASTTSANPSPLKLISFTGECNNQNIILKWSTISEINNEYFTIESSKDAINWEILDSIEGTSNSYIKNYSHLIEDPQLLSSFYRVKPINFSNEYEYSEIIEVKKCFNDLNEIDFELFPNPTNSFITVHTAQKEEMNIEITNMVGQVVQKSTFKHDINFDLQTLPKGMYIVNVKSISGFFSSKKLVVN